MRVPAIHEQRDSIIFFKRRPVAPPSVVQTTQTHEMAFSTREEVRDSIPPDERTARTRTRMYTCTHTQTCTRVSRRVHIYMYV